MAILDIKISQMLRARRMHRKLGRLSKYIGVVVNVGEKVTKKLRTAIRKVRTKNESTNKLVALQETRISKLEKDVEDAKKERKSLFELLAENQIIITKLEGDVADASKTIALLERIHVSTFVEEIKKLAMGNRSEQDASNGSTLTSEHLQALKDIRERRELLDDEGRGLVKEADATIDNLLNNISVYLGVYGLALQQMVNYKEYVFIMLFIGMMICGILGLLCKAFSKMSEVSGQIEELEEKHEKLKETLDKVKSDIEENTNPAEILLDVQVSLLEDPRFQSTETLLDNAPKKQVLGKSYWWSFGLSSAYALSVPVFLILFQTYGKGVIMLMSSTNEMELNTAT